MNNPVLELVKWISSHEEDVQTDIAFLMSGFNPVFDTSIASFASRTTFLVSIPITQ